MIDKTMIIKGIVTLSMRKNYYCLNIKNWEKAVVKISIYIKVFIVLNSCPEIIFNNPIEFTQFCQFEIYLKPKH